MIQRLYIGVVESYKQVYRSTTYFWKIKHTIEKDLGQKICSRQGDHLMRTFSNLMEMGLLLTLLSLGYKKVSKCSDVMVEGEHLHFSIIST